MARKTFRAAPLAALWLVAASASAQALPEHCAGGRVLIEGALDPRWSDSVARLCADLPTMKDGDPSARLRIEPDADALIVHVELDDGRATARRVRTPDELALTLEALIAIPLDAPPADAAPLAAPSPAAPPIPAQPHPQPQPSPLAPRAADRSLSMELGALVVGRFARAPSYVSPGLNAYAGIRVNDWLLGLTLRWDPLVLMVGQTPPNDFEMENVGAGFLISQSVLQSAAYALDLGANALLLAEKQSFRTGQLEHSDVDPDIRVGLFSRLLLGRSAWRWAVSLDAEFSPLRLRFARRIDSAAPTLPSWSLGLGLGAAWRGL